MNEIGHQGDVHYFSLDVEGGEYFVLQGYPFARNRFLLATVECHYPKGGDMQAGHMITHKHCQLVRNLMRDNGLIFMKTEGVDDIFIHVDLLREWF